MSDRKGQDSPDSRSGVPSQRLLELAVYLIVLIGAVYLLFQVPSWRRNDKLFPLLFGIPLVVLVVVKLVSIRPDGILKWVGRKREEPSSSSTEIADEYGVESPEGPGRDWRTELVPIGWPVAFLVAIYLVGFSYSVPFFLFAAVYYYLSDVRWAVIVAVIISIPIFLFEFTQGYLLWEGVLLG